MTLGKFRLTRQVKSLETRKPDELMEVPGSLGLTIGGTRLVEIPNRPGYVYVRIRDQLSEVVAAYNDQVSPIYDLPVLITRERTNRNRWKIKGRDLGRYEGWGSTAFLPNHHDQHEFNPIAPGGDVVWVYAQQFMPLAATPSGSSGAMSLIVKDFTYYRNSDWKYFPDTSTASFTPYKPTGSSAVMVLLYLNTSDNLAYEDGIEFAITTGTANIVPHIPDEPADCFIPIAGIYLLSGTSALTWDNIYEARPFFGSTATGTSGTGTDEKVKVSSDDTTSNYLENKIVAGVGVAVITLNGGGNETLSISVTNTGTSSGADEKTKVSANDTTAGYLNGKLVIGTGITLTELNDGGNETLRIDCTVTGTAGTPGAPGAAGSNTLLLYDNSLFKVTGSAISFEGGLDVSVTGSIAFVTWTGSSGGTDSLKVKVSSDDTTENYLENKVVAGTDISVTTLNAGGNETLSIAYTGVSGTVSSTYDKIFNVTFPPLLSKFTWVNKASGTATQHTNGDIYLTTDYGYATNDINILITSGSASVDFGFIIQGVNQGAGVQRAGVCWRESSSGKLHLAEMRNYTQFVSELYANPDTPNSDYIERSMSYGSATMWIRLENTGVKRNIYWSVNGTDFMLFDSQNYNDWMTPDQVGFFVGCSQTDIKAAMVLFSFKRN